MFAFDWKGEEPPSNVHDVRAAAATLALKLKWVTLVSYRFRITRAGIREKRLLVLVDSRVVLGTSQKDGRARENVISCFENKGFGLASDIALELVWVPTWANPADAPSRNKPIESLHASLPELLFTPTAVLATAPALSELNLRREPLSVAAHTAGEHVRNLEFSGAFNCSELKPAHVENETPCVGE